MELRSIGSSGLKVSALGIGCNNFGGRLDFKKSEAVVHAALDHGVTHFDTADMYPMGAGGLSEEFLGKALGNRRKDVVVASKFGMTIKAGKVPQGGSCGYIKEAIEASLKCLNTDWIDLFYLHTPDLETPIDETLRTLDELVKAGKIRHVASSNFAPWQTVEAHYVARELGSSRFIATQERYSLLSREIEKETIPLCKKYELGLVPFFPLESGVLSGKYKIGAPMLEGTRLSNSQQLANMFLSDSNLQIATELGDFASSQGKELIDLAFAWLLRDTVVPSVIAGASTPAQVARNAKAVEWQLSSEQIAAVAKILS